MIEHSHNTPFPKPALIALFSLIGLSLVSVAAMRLMGTTSSEQGLRAELSRDLRFEDQADGGIKVIDARANADIAILAPGSNGFLRAVMRGMVHERRRLNIADQGAFRLTAWEDGRLTIEDPLTGRSIELKAFGPTNAQSFGQLLKSADEVSP